jgi:hypothetical protein
MYKLKLPSHTLLLGNGSTFLLVFLKDKMLVAQNQKYCYMCMDIKELCNQVLIILIWKGAYSVLLG